MPQVSCSHCSRIMEYSGDRPSFCGYCGQALKSVDPEHPSPESTGDYDAPMTRFSVAHHGPDVLHPLQDTSLVDHARASSDERPTSIDRQISKYRLVRKLGSGGMGVVFEAVDQESGRKVALKLLSPFIANSLPSIERFQREGRLASSLAHPRCVFVLEADEDADGRPFIVMELMTGDTLQDVVEKNGPLEVGDAVAKILDVVDGLREAHRLGLIHRDVKPSNCFLDGEGRIKVGDFGLSKSQTVSTSLTRTGSFLGTPLYASPEQIKIEPLDARTDVYSTTATLYYLLTGRAPFDRGDAAATMARIVSDSPPSARSTRPEIPIGLDRAILKGLERDRDRRFADIDQLRTALQPFLPGQVAPARTMERVGAYLFDFFVVNVPMTLILKLSALPDLSKLALNLLLMMVYFAVSDGIWGGSPGKRLIRIRVTDAGGREPPGLARGAIRAGIFLLLLDLPNELIYPLSDDYPIRNSLIVLAGTLMGLGVLVAPTWFGSRRALLHDGWAGTRVVALPRDDRRRSAGSRRAIGKDRGSVTRPTGVIQTVGPYKVRGAVRWEPDRRVLAGEDSSLGREAWIVIRPKGSPAPDVVRREVSRATRPRWLAGGEQAEGRWDAYVAPAGSPLSDLAGPEGLSWRDARPILEDLADELAAACLEGTLPPGLTVDQVWVQPDGRAILVDPLAIARTGSDPGEPSPDVRALSLLRRVAAMALEGGRRRADDVPTLIRSPVPVHASSQLGRLLGGPDAYPTVSAFRADLETTTNLLTEVSSAQRATQLAILGLFLLPAIGNEYYQVYIRLAEKFPDNLTPAAREDFAFGTFLSVVVIVLLFQTSWMVWDFATRGGFALRLGGLALVRWDGPKAARWRVAWRSILVWLIPSALLIVGAGFRWIWPGPPWLCWAAYGAAIAVWPIDAVHAILFPSKGLQDRLSGLRVVPR